MASPRYFATPEEFRGWLDTHHDVERELWVGFYRKGSGKPSITWPESVDEALCVGWIDGVRKSLDDTSYMIRFTPRLPTSIWSNVNIAKVARLSDEGRMKPAGFAAYALRTDARSGVYQYEGAGVVSRDSAKFGPDAEREFRAQAAAWKFFQEQPPYYRKISTLWVVSAKRPETRVKRLAALIAYSAKGERLP